MTQIRNRTDLMEQDFDHLIVHAPNVIAQFAPDGNCLFANQAARRLFGFEQEGDALLWEAYGDGVVEAASSGEVITREIEFCLGGDTLYHECRFATRCDNGTVEAVYVTTRDVTDLRLVDHRYQQLFDTMLDGFALHEIITDDDGAPVDYRFLEVNPAFEKFTGLRRKDIIGKRVLEVLPETEPYWIETYGRVALTGEPIRFKNYAKQLDKHFEVQSFSPARGQFACAFLDITDHERTLSALIRSENHLAEKNRQLERMVYIASHDLRSPLLNVMGYAEELRHIMNEILEMLDECDDDTMTAPLDKLKVLCQQDGAEALGYIQAGGERMDRLVRSLLQLSRTERATPACRDVDMVELLEAVVQGMDFSAREIGADIKVDDNLPPCCADRDMLAQVFSNLVENAIRFRDADRSCVIRISGKRSGSCCEYEVRDNGIGISPKDQKTIFESFRSAHPDKSGEGLGLSIVEQIIDKHDGRIEVESVSGQGTTFRIMLPCDGERCLSRS